MNRQDAIQIRQRQLQGEAVSPDLLAEAIAVLQVVEPDAPRPKSKGGRPPGHVPANKGTSKRLRMRLNNQQVRLLKDELKGEK